MPIPHEHCSGTKDSAMIAWGGDYRLVQSKKAFLRMWHSNGDLKGEKKAVPQDTEGTVFFTEETSSALVLTSAWAQHIGGNRGNTAGAQ